MTPEQIADYQERQRQKSNLASFKEIINEKLEEQSNSVDGATEQALQQEELDH